MLEMDERYSDKFTMTPEEAMAKSPIRNCYCKLKGANPGFLFWKEGDEFPIDGCHYYKGEIAHLKWRPAGKEKDWIVDV